MSVTTKRWTAVRSMAVMTLACGALGCGPRSGDEPGNWMLGVFTEGPSVEGIAATGIAKYRVYEDNTATYGSIDGCVASAEEEIFGEFQWESRGKNQIAFLPQEGETMIPGGYDEWTLDLGNECNVLEVRKWRNGAAFPKYEIYRGDLCLRELPPCEPPGFQCDRCETVWCDDPPEPCDD